jgi:hypothetical protein
MLTDAQKEHFKTRGLVCLAGILPTENADRSREEIFQLCEKHGFWRDGRWQHGSSLVPSRVRKRLKKSRVRGSFMSPQVHDCMAELVAGAALAPWSEKPELLFSRPSGRDDALDSVSGGGAASPRPIADRLLS